MRGSVVRGRWQLDASGRLRRTGTVPCQPMGLPHDFVVTRRHLVIPVVPYHYEPDADAATFMDAHRWHPERPTRVLVVSTPATHSTEGCPLAP